MASNETPAPYTMAGMYIKDERKIKDERLFDDEPLFEDDRLFEDDHLFEDKHDIKDEHDSKAALDSPPEDKLKQKPTMEDYERQQQELKELLAEQEKLQAAYDKIPVSTPP